MSQLYIRVMTGFYTHRKTARLRAKIGDDAYWIPPRLWAYAAENQPNGNLSGYTSEELSELLGCSKYATSILQALLDSGYINPDFTIHDWGEHNGYHQKFSQRAKTAALARWAKEKSPTPLKEENERGKGKVETSIPQAMLGASELPTREQALATTMCVGIPPKFSEYVYADWASRNGKDGSGVVVGFLPYAQKRWVREQNDWRARTHKGNKAPVGPNGEPYLDPHRAIGNGSP